VKNFILLTDENIDVKKIQDVCRKAVDNEGLFADIDNDVTVSLTFVDEGEIRRLNNEYRGMDEPTDVLSFPLYDPNAPIIGEICLGDIVICPEIAVRQAQDIGQTTEREIAFLCVHSMLHLLGYDHLTEDDERIMIEKQKAIMEICQ
jgi:probable rRNA maturation factor